MSGLTNQFCSCGFNCEAYERMLKRNRPEDRRITFKHIKSGHFLHEDWLYNKINKCIASMVLLNADKDLSIIEKEYQK